MPLPLKNRAVMVLGMHRSGTSAFTGLLSLMGIDIGSRLLPASATNQSGYWEHAEIVDLNDRLLIALGSAWDDPGQLPDQWWKSDAAAPFHARLLEVLTRDFAASSLWALKDPRLCKLLPLWILLMEELECETTWILIARHPSEIIRSLETRQGILRQRSELLWLQYTLNAELQTRGRNRVVVTFDQLLDDWEGVLARVQWAIGVPWPVSPQQAAPRVAEFLNAGQRHHRAQEATELSRWTRDAYEGMLAGASGDEAAMRRLLDQTGAAFDAASFLYSPLLREGAVKLAAARDKYRLTKEKLDAKAAELKNRKEQSRTFERSTGGKLNRFLGRIKPKKEG